MSSTFSNLKFELIGTGEQSGTWGSTTNTNVGTAIEQAIVGMATLSSGDFTANVATLTLSNTNAAQNARALCLNIAAGAVSAAGTINVPAIQKPYIIINGSSYTVTVKVSGLTGVAVPAGTRTTVYNNGTDVGVQENYFPALTLGAALPIASGGTGSTSTTYVNLASNVTGTLPAANGGTGSASFTVGDLLYANTTTTLAKLGVGSTGQVVTVAGGVPTWATPASPGTGTVTSVSVVSANGFTGTVANATTTPAVTLTTSISGVIKGNGTALSAATAGTDYVAPGTATSFTALQTFSGTSSNAAAKLLNAKEAVTVSATAATGTITYDVTTQSVLYYTSNASANWTVNFRASSGTSLDSVMSTGESMTVAFLVTQGSTAYYNSAVQVDGSSVTPKWQGGIAPTSGSVSAINAYTYTIIKTGSAAFTVLASVSQFK
jgi:hypothetical protein